MTINNFKIASRVLWRDKFNTTVNLVGLTVGIACFLLLGLFVKQELSYDHFHSKKDRIYRSWLKEDYGNGKMFFNSQVPFRFESLFEDNFPEVEESVQFLAQTNLVGRGENRINEPIGIISPEFFDFFDFQLIDGNVTNPLAGKRDVVISEAYAKKYFGDENPIGKILPIQLDSAISDFTVTALLRDIRKESSIQFDIGISNANIPDIFGERSMTAWFLVAPETYVLVKENNSIESVSTKMQDVVMSYLADEVERDVYNIGFQPLTDIHLNPDIPIGYAPVSNPQYVYILAAIGILVLIIACINYATLAIGQSLKRGKEVGIRKVLGAFRTSLVYQYMSESLLITLSAMLIGIILTIVFIPAFNTLTGTEVFYQFQWWHLGVYLCLGLIISFIAGSYPALVLSGFKAVSILRGFVGASGSHSIRKGMVVFQFLITVFLISSSLIMRNQVEFLQNQDLGFKQEAVITIPLYPDPNAQRLSETIKSGFENGRLLKSKLEQIPEFTNIGMGSHVFGTQGWANLAYTESDGTFRRFIFLITDPYYLSASGIKFKEGRDFDPESGLDSRQSVIVNQAAVDYFGWENPIGEKLPGEEFGEHRIIGVTENFHFASLHTKVEPLVITQNLMPIVKGVSDGDFVDSVVPKLFLTYSGNNLAAAGEKLQNIWEETFPNENLNFSFVSERLANQYESESRMNKLIGVATVLSIFIASLGLLGLTVLVVNSRIKEIGIRKVMGASPGTIMGLLLRTFSGQLVLAIILSVPVTILLMNQWLQNFAYNISIGPGVFILSAILAALVAFLVIFYHTLRAAKINPIESLRTE